MTQDAKKSAKITVNNVAYTIKQLKNNSIQITPTPEKNTKETLREISKNVGFIYVNEWNTQYFGHKLINFLNSEMPESISDKASSTQSDLLSEDTDAKFFRWHELGVSMDIFEEMEDEQEIEALCQKLGIEDPDELNWVSNEAWNWWVKLSPSMKFILLYSIPRDYEEFGDFELPYCVDDMLCAEDGSELEFDFESEENRQPIGYCLTDLISTLDSIDITAAEEAEESSCLEYEFEELAYLPNLTEMSFYRGDWCYFPPNLTALKHLTVLNFARTEIGGDTPEEDLENLFEFAKSHPKMEVLDLSGTPLADELSENGKLAELQALMPNCEIKL